MTNLIYYDLKVAALIGVFYLFYMLLLARETTHTLNRVVLLSGIVLSLVLPLCIVTMHQTVIVGSVQQTMAEAIDETVAKPEAEVSIQHFDWSTPLAIALLSGTFFRLLFLAQGYKKLRRMILGGEKHTLPADTRVCVVDATIAPFSWMHTVVLSRDDWQSQPAPILAHEEAHVRHHHSYDVVVVEMLTALQWFNPVVWFLRQELRIVHEYEADASVLSRGFDESQYIHLLMQKATGIQACVLANGIHTPKTKKRILMMLKPKSGRTAWLKALYVVPIALASLAMTARTVVDYETAPTEDELAVQVFTEKANGRGDSYQIRHSPDVLFYNNGKVEAIPGDRPIALEVKQTTMMLNGVKFDRTALPQLPVSALREIHLNKTGPDLFVCNLVTAQTASAGAGSVPASKYSLKMSDLDVVNYVKQQQAAGLDEKALEQLMLNEAGSISRAHILHVIRAYGSNKNRFFVIDGKEATREEFNLLKPEAIASAKVMDVGPAKKAFGEKGRYGATVVETMQMAADTPQKVFDTCEQMPQFPGGDVKLMGFISRNIKYPQQAMECGLQGRVIVQFIVEKDGSLSNVKTLENPKKSFVNMVEVTAMMSDKQRQDAEAHNRAVQALRDEAIRVVKAMPRWTPGRQKGQAVRCNFVIPVTYRLN